MMIRAFSSKVAGGQFVFAAALLLLAACSSQSPALQGRASGTAPPGTDSGEKSGTGKAPANGAGQSHQQPAGKAANAEVGMAHEYSQQEREKLLHLARQTLETVVRTGRMPTVPPEDFAGHLSEKRGCFVTLTRGGHLRGCIGHIFAQEALYRAVMDNARAAALEDPRFPAVTPDELSSIHIEISVLSEPKPLEFSSPEDLLARLVPGRDGVVLKMGWRRSTFLPQVWEQLPDKEMFLNHLAQKAGAYPGAWREPGTEVLIYHVEAFEEPER